MFLKTYGKSIHLNETNKENGIKISTVIQNFILYILKKLRSRLPFDDIVVQKISAFDPECGTTVEDIARLADKYDNIIEPDQYHIILSEIKEWEFEIKNSGKLLAKAKSHRHVRTQDLNLEIFFIDPYIEDKFPLITKLGRALVSLPHTSASIERVFSQMKLIKSEKRTNLLNETFESLLITKVNGIDLDEEKTLNALLERYGPKLEDIKRKSTSQIEPSQLLVSSIPQQNDMIPESNSDNESISNKMKKVKLTTSKNDLDTISNLIYLLRIISVLSVEEIPENPCKEQISLKNSDFIIPEEEK